MKINVWRQYRSIICYVMVFHFCYVWLEFYRHTQFHITTLQRVIRIMHHSPTLRHIPAPAVCTRTVTEGAYEGISDGPHNPDTLALIILLFILPTSEGWKAESTLPPPGFEPGTLDYESSDLTTTLWWVSFCVSLWNLYLHSHCRSNLI